MWSVTGLTNSTIFRQEYIMQLNDSTATTMLQTKFMDDCIGHDSDVDVFMSALRFPLTCSFSNIPEIDDSKARLYASIFINHCYVEYYR